MKGVTNIAVPFPSAITPSVLLPSAKLSVPVATGAMACADPPPRAASSFAGPMPPGLAAALTVTVNATQLPSCEGLAELVTLTIAGSLFTVCVNVALDATALASPP